MITIVYDKDYGIAAAGGRSGSGDDRWRQDALGGGDRHALGDAQCLCVVIVIIAN